MLGQQIKGSLSVFGGNVTVQAPNGEKISDLAVIKPLPAGLNPFEHGRGHPQLGRVNNFGSFEPLGRNTDYLEGMVVEYYFLADKVWVTREAALPGAIADYNHRIGRLRPVLFRQKCAAFDRLHTQHIKIIAGNFVTPDALVSAFATQA